MAETILFVFEGKKTEQQILNSLKAAGLLDNPNRHIVATYQAEIYQLYRAVVEDEDLDIVEILRERLFHTEDLDGVSRQDVSDVFLFFDYDGHATNASDETLQALLARFNAEHGHGKLFISYPMVEAFRHIDPIDSFSAVCVSATETGYKQIVHQCCENATVDLRCFSRLSHDVWKDICLAHWKKANYIMCDLFEYPDRLHTQDDLFGKQLEKYITPNDEVAVLSAFPMFLIDYYGLSKFRP